jgi:hypothetical protein
MTLHEALDKTVFGVVSVDVVIRWLWLGKWSEPEVGKD